MPPLLYGQNLSGAHLLRRWGGQDSRLQAAGRKGWRPGHALQRESLPPLSRFLLVLWGVWDHKTESGPSLSEPQRSGGNGGGAVGMQLRVWVWPPPSSWASRTRGSSLSAPTNPTAPLGDVPPGSCTLGTGWGQSCSRGALLLLKGLRHLRGAVLRAPGGGRTWGSADSRTVFGWGSGASPAGGDSRGQGRCLNGNSCLTWIPAGRGSGEGNGDHGWDEGSSCCPGWLWGPGCFQHRKSF